MKNRWFTAVVFAGLLFSSIGCYKHTNESDYYFDKGLALQKKKDIDKALFYYNKALGIEPKGTIKQEYILINIAGIYEYKKDADQALLFYGKVLELAPDYSSAYAGRARISLFDKNNPEQAIKDSTKAIQIEEASEETKGFPGIQKSLGEIYYVRAMAYAMKGEFDKSWEDVHKAESLGQKIDAKFLEQLKKDSGRKN